VLYNRTIIGYHGCHEDVAEEVLAGAPFKKSEERYDWLGPGTYFWEHGPDRAARWAEQKYKERGAVVGALIHLGDCFDLLDTRVTMRLAEAFELFKAAMASEQRELPRNKGPELKARYLDCAMIKWYLEALATRGTKYHSVRCGFVEGGAAFEGSEIRKETHIQIAVRDAACIVGVFRPREPPAEETLQIPQNNA
jgi:hypothetical protein